jgi:hypothetical protein
MSSFFFFTVKKQQTSLLSNDLVNSDVSDIQGSAKDSMVDAGVAGRVKYKYNLT